MQNVLEFSIKSKFWPGFVLVLERSDPETRWNHLKTVLEIGQIENLVRLGFFSSEENCSKLFENFLFETEKSEKDFELTVEQISMKMFESIGVQVSML